MGGSPVSENVRFLRHTGTSPVVPPIVTISVTSPSKWHWFCHNRCQRLGFRAESLPAMWVQFLNEDFVGFMRGPCRAESSRTTKLYNKGSIRVGCASSGVARLWVQAW